MTDDTTAAVAAALERAMTGLYSEWIVNGRKNPQQKAMRNLWNDRAVLAQEVERWRTDWHRVETILFEIQATADGGGMAGHDMSEDLRRFKLISDLVDIIWQTDATHPATAGRGSA